MPSLIATGLVFLLPCALVALALALPHPRRWLAWAALLAPAVALMAAYADAALHQRGDKVTLEVLALRIGQARLAGIAPGREQVLLVVGDRAEAADLVVPSAADPRQAEADLALAPRTLMQVVAVRTAEGVLAIRLELDEVAPDPATGLPGMEAVAQETPLAGTAIRPGEERRIAINRIEPNGERVLRRMLAITLLAAEDGADPAVRIGLDTPLRAAAGSCGFAGGDMRLDLRLQPATGTGAANSDFASPDRLVFDELGLGGAAPLLAPSLLGPVADPAQVCSGADVPFVWPARDNGADARLELGARVATLDWFLPLFALATSLGLLAVAGRGWPGHRAEFAAVALAGLLIGYRLLAAIAAPYYDAALDPAAVPVEAATGFLAVPVALVALLRRNGPREDWQALGVLLAGGSAALALWLGAWPGLLVAWPVLAAAGLLAWRYAGSPPPRLTLPDWIARRTPFEQAAMLVLTAIAVRFALALPPLSARERLLGLPLTVPYLASLLAGFALMLHHGREWRQMAVVVALALVAGFAIPWWVRDSGFAFLAAPPLLALIALYSFATRQARPARTIAAAPLVLAPVALAAVSALLAAQANGLADLPLLARMQAMLGFSGNELRLIQFIDPDALGAIVTRQAYAAIEQQHLLGQLSAGLTGQGWLAPASLHSLRSVQLSDNVAAVHAMWPFGRLAVLGLLAAMAALWIAASRGRAPLPQGPMQLASWLAAAWLVWAMAYMLCANLMLVPFIGRNIYFLSATSGGDLLEGAMLLAIALWPVRERSA